MPPDDAALIDRLAALPLFQSVPRHELAWLVAHGEQRTLEAGTVVSTAHRRVADPPRHRACGCRGLPRVHGFGSEINQVWEKLVHNALDAVGTARCSA